MKTLLVLGAGTAGTMIAKKMAKKLDSRDWKVILVDKDPNHYYQPGFLFIPFGKYGEKDVIRKNKQYIPSNIEYILSNIEMIEPDASQVRLTLDNRVIQYDYLVIATGCDIHPEETEGTLDGWRKDIFDFYTYDGSVALQKYLNNWKGGRLVVNVVENPIKCPVAPLEFLFLADWVFTQRGMRDKVELVYATPLTGAFTKPVSAVMLGDVLAKKNIKMETEFNAGSVDAEKKILSSYDEREIPYDLLVSVPVNMGSDLIKRSGMGDSLNFIPTDNETLQSSKYQNIWVMGDATNIPASKAGAVIHFQLGVVEENLLAAIHGKELHAKFDGHSSCYIESGFNKGILIDFSYNQEPLPGTYPIPGIGPFSLLKESFINHIGKMGFKYLYWELMLRGIEVPLPSKFSMAGKVQPKYK